MPRSIVVAVVPSYRRLIRVASFCLSLLAVLHVTAPILSAATPGELQAQRRQHHLEKIAQQKKLVAGSHLFTKTWQSRRPHDGAGDGLGPLFNERSCAACHKLGALGGAGPNDNNVQLIGVDASSSDSSAELTFDDQLKFVLPTAKSDVFILHRFGVDPKYHEWRRQRLSFAAPESGEIAAANAMLRVRDLLAANGQGSKQATDEKTLRHKLESLVIFYKEERNTTALFGAGLIDGIAEAELERIAAEQAGTIVHGRVPRTHDGRVGRFGWKGENGTLNEFNEGACAAELGLQTARIDQAVAPSLAQGRHRASAVVAAEPLQATAEVDITADEIMELTAFVASLPAPVQIVDPLSAGDVAAGAFHFQQIGCAECHRPEVGSVQGVYSDLLLHRVGTVSKVPGYYHARPVRRTPADDDIPKSRALRTADPDEFRTPPLWGVADSAPYMHDGRAPNLEIAIELHAEQASHSARIYKRLEPREKRQLLAFLCSLRAPR